jgi:CTP-dependent riboflavin kinase
MNDEVNQDNRKPEGAEHLPIGIARLREEWRKAGLVPAEQEPDESPVVFPEPEAGGAIGDYLLSVESVRERLGLSEAALDRLLASGELDSILVKQGERIGRMISQTSLNRFLEDAAMDREVTERHARCAETRDVMAEVQSLAGEIEQLKQSQTRQLQQMKDMLLLELRNIKGQELDLTSFVNDLAEEIRKGLHKKR